MNKIILAFFAVLFAFPISAHAQIEAQNCSVGRISFPYHYVQNPPGTPASTNEVTFPDYDFCPGFPSYPNLNYTITVSAATYCDNTNARPPITYDRATLIVSGKGFLGCLPILPDAFCDPRIEAEAQTAINPTDYNRFYLRAFSVPQYGPPFDSDGCPSRTFDTQDFWQCSAIACTTPSPVVIDVSGQGFLLTNAQNGVMFDISGTGHPIQMGWTATGVNNAFLALPGTDGLVHNGQQLFGNFTPQPPSTTPNGFAALAVYDDPSHGGNGDGIIDAHDAIFASLRLWIDANHDGISQPSELFTLPSLGVYSISLHYQWFGRRDQYGNLFRYGAQINPGGPSPTGRMAYDVFFVTAQPAARTNTSSGQLSARSFSCPVVKPTLALPSQKASFFH